MSAQCSRSNSQRSDSAFVKDKVNSSSSSDRSLASPHTQDIQESQKLSGVFNKDDRFSDVYELSHAAYQPCHNVEAWADVRASNVVELPIIQSSYKTDGAYDQITPPTVNALSSNVWNADGDAQHMMSSCLLNMQPWRHFIPNAFERQLDHRLDRLWGNHKAFSRGGSGWHRVTTLFGRTFSELFRMSKQLAENVR